MFLKPDEQVTLFGGDFFHMKSHMKLLEFIIEFSEKKKQRKLANETSKNDLTMEGMKTHIVKSTYQIRKNGEEKR
jgi:hypothetical protein